MKVAVVTCYRDPDYVRARSLRAALGDISDIETIVVKNTRRGILRYPEILVKLWRVRRTERPDVFLLTFRGQDILPLVLLIAGKKPVWFDEFIVPGAYARGENHKKTVYSVTKHAAARLAEPLYNSWLRRCAAVLADTSAHAELGATAAGLDRRVYSVVPVGADETVFHPSAKTRRTATFSAFYYSSGMQPLHGIGTVIEAALLLRDVAGVEFHLAGGGRRLRSLARAAVADGARIFYESWIPFRTLPDVMRTSGICLGGPFGNTPQARRVITGKTYQVLACESPVIVGESDVVGEYFVDKKNALVVPQADSRALADAVLWAAGHPDELREIAAAGRSLFEAEFSAPAIARRLRPLVDAQRLSATPTR